MATAGARGIFDIDGGDTGGAGSFHSALRLYDSNGQVLSTSTIFNVPTAGQSGSVSDRHAYLGLLMQSETRVSMNRPAQRITTCAAGT